MYALTKQNLSRTLLVIKTNTVHNAPVISNEFRLWLRAEALITLAAAFAVFSSQEGNWLYFAALFFTPDFSMLGYFGGNRLGSFTYNLFHNYAIAGFCLLAAFVSGNWHPLSLVWPAHIAFDRLFGYGLKSNEGFKITHLGTL